MGPGVGLSDSAHILGVSFIVKQDVTSDPADVGFFGADGVMFDSDGLTDPVE